jgi:adenylate cyclase
VAGIVWTSRFRCDLWSDNVQTAAGMESHGQAGRIQITRAPWERIRDSVPCEGRGTTEVKGTGPTETWWAL